VTADDDPCVISPAGIFQGGIAPSGISSDGGSSVPAHTAREATLGEKVPVMTLRVKHAEKTVAYSLSACFMNTLT